MEDILSRMDPVGVPMAVAALLLMLLARPLCRLCRVPAEKEENAVLIVKLISAALCVFGLIFTLGWL